MRTELCEAGDEGCIERAVRLLRAGEIVAFPTDTVYGLGAIAEDDAAVARIFAVKERPPDRPLPIFVASISDVAGVAYLGEDGERLARAFWPGALTIVAVRNPSFASRALLDRDTVGVRIPASPAALAITRDAGRPLAVTSANRSGAGSIATAAEVLAALGGFIPLLVDGGRLAGTESTIVDITGVPAHLLREGAIPRESIAEVLRMEASLL